MYTKVYIAYVLATLISSISEFGETRPSLINEDQEAGESPSPEVAKDRAGIGVCVL